jgi:carbon monoxide dehydrogenase subunit G
MKLKGSVDIKASREIVWEFITNPQAVGECAPGVESVEVVIPDQKFQANAAIGFGSVKATFVTVVEWVELLPPERAKLKAHGDAPGSAADITSEITLKDLPDGGTNLTWAADVVVLGKIAGLASRMMGGVSKKLSRQFFECMKGQIEAAGHS